MAPVPVDILIEQSPGLFEFGHRNNSVAVNYTAGKISGKRMF